MAAGEEIEVDQLVVPPTADIIDSPIDPLQTREIENATDSESSENSEEYFSFDSSSEDSQGHEDGEEEVVDEGEFEDENEDEQPLIAGLEQSYDSPEEQEEEPVAGPSGLNAAVDWNLRLESGVMEMEYNDDEEEESVSIELGIRSESAQLIQEEAVDADYEGDLEDEAEAVYYEDDEEGCEDEFEIEYETEESESDEEPLETTEEEVEDDGDLDEEDVSEEELGDLDEEEEFVFDENYHPSKIPPLVEHDTASSFVSSITELRAAIAEEDSFPFVLLDDFQLDLEDYMRANLFKQLSLMDEISKLLTNCPAEFELEDLHPSADIDPPTEEIPIDFKPTAERKMRCSQKSQKLSFLWELWWAWVESAMPKISTDVVKSFKTIMIDKMKPKYMSEYYVNEPSKGLKPTAIEKPMEDCVYGVRLCELQIVEDDELDSDYEPDTNGPIYYKMPRYTPDRGEDTPEYPEVVFQEEGIEYEESDTDDSTRKRKRSASDLPSIAKRRRVDAEMNSSTEFIAPPLPPPLVLSRRRSSQSFRSSTSPPMLTPQLTPRTPIKIPESPLKQGDVESCRSDNEASRIHDEEKAKRARARAERKKHAPQRKQRRKEKVKNRRESPEEEASQKREEFCDSESVLSISDVDFDLTEDEAKSFDGDRSFMKLRLRLAELKEEAKLAEQLEELGTGGVTEQYEELVHLKPDTTQFKDAEMVQSDKPEDVEIEADEMQAITEVDEKGEYSQEREEFASADEESELELYDSDVEAFTDPDDEQSDYYDDEEEEEEFDAEPVFPSNAALDFYGVIIDGDDLEKLAFADVVDVGLNGEVVDLTEGDQVFPGHTIAELNTKFVQEELDAVSVELLKGQKDFTVAAFQFQKKSKIFLDYLSQEVERQSLLEIVEEAEGKLFDNLEGPSTVANVQEMVESFHVLSTYYKDSGVTCEDVADDSIDLLALKHLNVADRTF